MTQMMKVAAIERYGLPSELKLMELPRPEPQAGEVLVQVYGAGVNPIDWKTRSGSGLAGRYGQRFPLVLGWDVAGMVTAVGADVTQFNVGDAIYGMPRFPEIGGGYAEYTAVPATHIAPKPHSLTYLQAAGLPLVGLTAWQGLFEKAALQAGQRILIHAAAGGVGHVAVQLAKWKGAYVIGTASARHEAFLRQLGCDEVIDYTSIRFEDVVRDVDVVLDGMAGETRQRSWQVLKPEGILVSLTGALDETDAAAHNVRATRMLVYPSREQLAQLARLVDGGHLHIALDTVLPLAAAAQAHQLGEQGHTQGKLVLQVV